MSASVPSNSVSDQQSVPIAVPGAVADASGKPIVASLASMSIPALTALSLQSGGAVAVPAIPVSNLAPQPQPIKFKRRRVKDEGSDEEDEGRRLDPNMKQEKKIYQFECANPKCKTRQGATPNFHANRARTILLNGVMAKCCNSCGLYYKRKMKFAEPKDPNRKTSYRRRVYPYSREQCAAFHNSLAAHPDIAPKLVGIPVQFACRCGCIQSYICHDPTKPTGVDMNRMQDLINVFKTASLLRDRTSERGGINNVMAKGRKFFPPPMGLPGAPKQRKGSDDDEPGAPLNPSAMQIVVGPGPIPMVGVQQGGQHVPQQAQQAAVQAVQQAAAQAAAQRDAAAQGQGAPPMRPAGMPLMMPMPGQPGSVPPTIMQHMQMQHMQLQMQHQRPMPPGPPGQPGQPGQPIQPGQTAHMMQFPNIPGMRGGVQMHPMNMPPGAVLGAGPFTRPPTLGLPPSSSQLQSPTPSGPSGGSTSSTQSSAVSASTPALPAASSAAAVAMPLVVPSDRDQAQFAAMLANDPAAQEAHENAMVNLQRSRLSDMYLTYMLEKNHQYSGFLCLEARKKLLLFSNSLLYGKPLVDAGGFKTKAPSLAAVFKKKQTQEGRSYTRRKIKRVALGSREATNAPMPPQPPAAAIAITPDKLAMMKKPGGPVFPAVPNPVVQGQPGIPPAPPQLPPNQMQQMPPSLKPPTPNVASVAVSADKAKMQMQTVISQASPDQLRKMAQLLQSAGISMDFNRPQTVGPPPLSMHMNMAMIPPQLISQSAPQMLQQPAPQPSAPPPPPPSSAPTPSQQVPSPPVQSPTPKK